MSLSLETIQKEIVKEGLDGWLLYDFHQKNHLMYDFLAISKESHITRRIFYWIPASGTPVKIVHKIEPSVLKHVPGDTRLYRNLDELKEVLKALPKRIILEYSKAMPAISLVDGGTVDFLRDLGFEIHSSKEILQRCTSVLSESQIESHKAAAKVLNEAVGDAFHFISDSHKRGKRVFEGDVQRFILDRFEEKGCMTNHPPIVARGENSANPHYAPEGRGSEIQKGDFVLIDLWCKKKEGDAVYADITRVSMLGPPTEAMQRVFSVVREAQERGVSYIRKTKRVRGCDVDTHVREYLESEGFKEAILHRLGHSIDKELHGSGANLDSFETTDDRFLIPNTCYSIEPALYFPGEFGVRLEFDILYLGEGQLEITGGIQDSLTL